MLNYVKFAVRLVDYCYLGTLNTLMRDLRDFYHSLES